MATQPKDTGTALQPFAPMLKQAFKSLRRINVKDLEAEVGVHLPAGALRDAVEPANVLFAHYKAQRERLAKAKIPATVPEMIKLPAGSKLRSATLGYWFPIRKLSECEVLVRLPPGDKALAGFEAYLNEATPLILREEFVGKGKAPTTPKFKVVGIGEDASGVGEHNEEIVAARAARLAASS